MPSSTPLTDAINALTTYANETTGASDTNLSDAIGTLVDGYGQGGEDQISGLYDGTVTSVEVTSAVLGRAIFRGYRPLTSFKAPNATKMDSGYTLYDTRLTIAVFPKMQDIAGYAPMGSITTLLVCDIGDAKHLSNSTFNGSTKLNVLILRGNTVAKLDGTGAFTNTPFASGGAGGTLYVPSSLISSYQSATNWSTILGYTNNSIEAIEGSQYENYYADGTPIS